MTLPMLWAIAAALSAITIVLIKPLLVRYALARPNARSSHVTPTPQGGGIAVIAAAFIVSAGGAAWSGLDPGALAVLAVASLALAAVGAYDDIAPLPPAPRLVLQIACVAGVVVAATSGIRLLPPQVPVAIEWSLATLAGVWFVNLVNFMDGLDWITVAEMVPVTGGIAILGAAGIVDPRVALVATALCGALIGFAWFNKPVARLFLGDVGSLPIGLIVAWLLFMLAAEGHIAAAILLPLYYCADATLTLLLRARRGERLWEAHRTHFYQRATDHGFTALAVSSHVFILNLVLAALAVTSILAPSTAVAATCLILGASSVGWTLLRFTRRPLGRTIA